jgi:hypothetical protein
MGDMDPGLRGKTIRVKPGESSERISTLVSLICAVGQRIFNYKTSIISVTELVVLVSTLLAIGGLRVPAPLIWFGFAANLLLSLLPLV